MALTWVRTFWFCFCFDGQPWSQSEDFPEQEAPPGAPGSDNGPPLSCHPAQADFQPVSSVIGITRGETAIPVTDVSPLSDNNLNDCQGVHFNRTFPSSELF